MTNKKLNDSRRREILLTKEEGLGCASKARNI